MQGEFGYDEMVHFEDHVSGSDPFSTPETEARGNWYGVSGIPHVRIDGKYSVVGAGSCAGAATQYRQKINQRLAEVGAISPVQITGSHLVNEGELAMNATFKLLDPATLVNLRATLLIYEDNVFWCCGYGGVDTWQHVTRVIYDQNVTLTNVGDEANLSTTVTLPGDWNPDELHVVAYLQQTSGDKQIIQGAVIPEVADFTFGLAKGVDSVPQGNGTAVFNATLTNISNQVDTFTLEPGSPFGNWTTDFKFCGSANYFTTPQQVVLNPQQACAVEIRVHTDSAHEIRSGGFRVTSAGSARTQQNTMRVFNDSYAVLFVDDDYNHADETSMLNALNALGYLHEHWDMQVRGKSPIYKNVAGFDYLIWDTSWWASQPNAVSPEDQGVIKAFMDDGGSLFLVSQLLLNQVGAPNDFTTNYLGIASWELDKAYDRLHGVAGDPIGDGIVLPLTFQYPSFKKGDHVVPGPNAVTCFTTSNPGPWNAAIRNTMPLRGSAKSVFMASAWQAISQSDPDPNNARVVLQRILDWLRPEAPADVGDLALQAGASRIVSAAPNPFEGRTEIAFALSGIAADRQARVEVFDLAGRKVATLLDEALPAGPHSILWDGRADQGGRIQSGVYFVRLTTVEGSVNEKLLVLR